MQCMAGMVRSCMRPGVHSLASKSWGRGPFHCLMLLEQRTIDSRFDLSMCSEVHSKHGQQGFKAQSGEGLSHFQSTAKRDPAKVA